MKVTTKYLNSIYYAIMGSSCNMNRRELAKTILKSTNTCTSTLVGFIFISRRLKKAKWINILAFMALNWLREEIIIKALKKLNFSEQPKINISTRFQVHNICKSEQEKAFESLIRSKVINSRGRQFGIASWVSLTP